MVVCGTKADSRTSEEKSSLVKFSDAKRMARAYNCAGPVECSALTNMNLNAVFTLGKIGSFSSIGVGCTYFTDLHFSHEDGNKGKTRLAARLFIVLMLRITTL